MLLDASKRRISRVLGVPRCSLREVAVPATVPRSLGDALVERLRQLIAEHPTSDCREPWALPRHSEVLLVSRSDPCRRVVARGRRVRR